MPKNITHVKLPKDIPTVEHWAIIEGSSVYHEETGVWAPGHGYPAYSEDVIKYQAYLNEEEFKLELEKRFNQSSGNKIIGIHVDKLYTSKTVVQVIETKLPA